MEEGKKTVAELISSLKNLRLALESLIIRVENRLRKYFPDSFSLPLKKTKPPSLVNSCLGFLGQYLEDIIADISEIAAVFPSDIKLALVAIARRQLLNDDLLVALAEVSWKILDIYGSNVTDYGLKKVVEICTSLQAVDISHCDKITATGVSGLICHCQSLEILRCGGFPSSDSTAFRCVGILKPKLNNVEEESWEKLENADIGSGAPSLRWLVCRSGIRNLFCPERLNLIYKLEFDLKRGKEKKGRKREKKILFLQQLNCRKSEKKTEGWGLKNSPHDQEPSY